MFSRFFLLCCVVTSDGKRMLGSRPQDLQPDGALLQNSTILEKGESAIETYLKNIKPLYNKLKKIVQISPEGKIELTIPYTASDLSHAEVSFSDAKKGQEQAAALSGMLKIVGVRDFTITGQAGGAAFNSGNKNSTGDWEELAKKRAQFLYDQLKLSTIFQKPTIVGRFTNEYNVIIQITPYIKIQSINEAPDGGSGSQSGGVDELIGVYDKVKAVLARGRVIISPDETLKLPKVNEQIVLKSCKYNNINWKSHVEKYCDDLFSAAATGNLASKIQETASQRRQDVLDTLHDILELATLVGVQKFEVKGRARYEEGKVEKKVCGTRKCRKGEAFYSLDYTKTAAEKLGAARAISLLLHFKEMMLKEKTLSFPENKLFEAAGGCQTVVKDHGKLTHAYRPKEKAGERPYSDYLTRCPELSEITTDTADPYKIMILMSTNFNPKALQN